MTDPHFQAAKSNDRLVIPIESNCRLLMNSLDITIKILLSHRRPPTASVWGLAGRGATKMLPERPSEPVFA